MKRHCPTTSRASLWILVAALSSVAQTGRADKTAHGDPRLSPRRTFLKTAFRSTVESTIRKPITTYRLGRSISRRRGAALIEDNLPVRVPLSFSLSVPPAPGSPDFEAHLDGLWLEKPIKGEMSYHLGGESSFRAFEKELAAARQSIDIQVYIFDNDDAGVRCADLLRARAVDIPVRVLLDDLGSTFAHGRNPPSGLPAGFEPPPDIARYMLRNDSKILLRQTVNPWLVTDHTKLHIFDRRIAFLGGMNLGRESRREWHDLMVGLRGPILAALARDFEQTWRRNGPRGDLTLFEKETPLEIEDGPGVPLRILRTDAAQQRSDILLAMSQAIRGATHRIWIEMPYFSADVIERELEAAASRGVDVRVILPARANHGIMNAGNLVTARNLLQAGIRVYQYPGMTHLKAMICDGWATVGSANLDTISLRINRELNVSFSDPKLVKELAELVFETDFKTSRLLTRAETKLNFSTLIETIADQF